ncbi:hypothetical protein M8C21_005458, partial [Ambrosia artemisiifolia]
RGGPPTILPCRRTSNHPSLPRLLHPFNGLRRLEYRGYDSAGISIDGISVDVQSPIVFRQESSIESLVKSVHQGMVTVCMNFVCFDGFDCLSNEVSEDQLGWISEDWMRVGDDVGVGGGGSGEGEGTVWTALAHIITGVIGSGVLSLAWSMAQLGWIGGPLCLLLFAFFTLVSAYFISDVHIYSNPNNGNTTMNRSYLQAVHTILGYKNGLVCGCLVYFSVFKTAVVYTITSSISMRAIRQSNCYHEEGHEAACEFSETYYMLMFGMVQILASQIPNIFQTKWLSIIASIMSFTYSFIGMGLGLAQIKVLVKYEIAAKGKVEGSISGISTANPTQKVWLVAQALGDIAFSYTFSLILLEIQSTLKSPPSQKVTMKRASTIAVFTTTIFYLCCGGFGYAAFGDSTPGNLLTGFGFYEPYWLVDFGNACIVLHLVGGY